MTLARVLILACLFAGCVSSTSVRPYSGPLGKIDRSQLDMDFMAKYDSMEVSKDFLDLIRQVNQGVDVVVFLGTWCSDSRREVPHFLKIMDQAGIPMTRVTLYALDRQKKTPDGTANRYDIERVPTFVFVKNGDEIGRIVESPKTTLEGDIVAILAAAHER
jgi:thiol-disulfide isomerase/thioredoxin